MKSSAHTHMASPLAITMAASCEMARNKYPGGLGRVTIECGGGTWFSIEHLLRSSLLVGYINMPRISIPVAVGWCARAPNVGEGDRTQVNKHPSMECQLHQHLHAVLGHADLRHASRSRIWWHYELMMLSSFKRKLMMLSETQMELALALPLIKELAK